MKLPFAALLFASSFLQYTYGGELSKEQMEWVKAHRAVCPARDKRFPIAIECFIAATNIRPNAGEAWADLSMAIIDGGEKDQASDQASEALARALHFQAPPEAILMLGVAMMKRSRLKEALASFQYAAKKNPQDGRAILNLGALQQTIGQIPAALVSYRQAVKVQPSYSAYFNLATSLQATGEHDAAADAIKHALTYRKDADTLATQASISLSRGASSEALKACEAAIALDPAHADAHHQRKLAHQAQVKEGGAGVS